MTTIASPRPGARKVQVSWDLDPDNPTHDAVLILRIPTRAWTPGQRRTDGQAVADSALHALHAMEQDGVRT